KALSRTKLGKLIEGGSEEALTELITRAKAGGADSQKLLAGAPAQALLVKQLEEGNIQFNDVAKFLTTASLGTLIEGGSKDAEKELIRRANAGGGDSKKLLGKLTQEGFITPPVV